MLTFHLLFLPPIFKEFINNSFTHSKYCIDGHVGYLHIFSVMNTAVMNVFLCSLARVFLAIAILKTKKKSLLGD